MEVLRHWRENTKPDQYGENDFSLHESDDDATTALAATFAEIPSPARLFGSIHDDADWAELSDGSRVAAVFLDNAVSGPMVLLTNNAPGVVEAPAGSYGDDRMRLIMKGSCTIGDREFHAQDFRATEAGIVEGPVVHGPEGSSQVVVYADRRHWLPILDGGTSATEECPRLGEIATVLEPYLVSAMAVG
jgi:hypothetical protein